MYDRVACALSVEVEISCDSVFMFVVFFCLYWNDGVLVTL